MSSYTYGSTSAETSVAHHSHYEIGSLQTEVEDLGRRVDDVEEYRSELENKLEGYDKLVSDVASAESSAEELDDTVSALTARVAWLEGALLRAELVAVADFAFDADERRLAETATKGRRARRGLLTEGQRAVKRNTITLVEQAAENNGQAVRDAAAAAGVLAETALGDVAHTDAAGRYSRARNTIRSTAQTVHQYEDAAATYAAELAADDAARRKAAPVIAKGSTAASDLATRLRTRLVDALGQYAMMPPWFASVLGPAAPAGAPAQWFDAATALLVYRCTFGITHSTSALGPEPPFDDTDKREARRQVAAKLRDAQHLG